MNTNLLHYILWGNTVKSYLLFAGIILFCLFFKKLFSRLFSHFLLKLFGRFGKEVNAAVFVELLVKPVEFFISLDLIYIAINQLTYPLNEVIFLRKNMVDKIETVTSI